MKVLKFGGTSVKSAEMMKQVGEIVKNARAEGQVAVVVSAMSGITDQLINVSTLASQGNDTYQQTLKEIEKKHLQCIQELLPPQHQTRTVATIKMTLNELEDVLQGLFLLKEISPKSRDFVMSFGERMSSAIITEYFKTIGLDALLADGRELIVTDDNFGNAVVDFEETDKRIRKYFSRTDKLIVMGGFIGATVNNETTTLGRGGSDYTGSIIAAALQAKMLEIWTDVDGMMTADPRKVRRTMVLKQLSYIEALELSHFGAKVLYPPSVQPVLAKNIPLKIKNTFNPAAEGTLVARESVDNGSPIKGISSIDTVALISLNGSGMVGVSGFAKRLFSALASGRINVILITQASSEHSITVAINASDAAKAKTLIESEFVQELKSNALEPVVVEQDLSILAIVGENMRNTPNVSGKLFSSLGRNGVNVRAIAQGSSENNISFVTQNADSRKALNIVHEAFFLSDTRVLNIFLVGVGTVGGTLLRQMREQQEYFLHEYNLELRVTGVANSRKMWFDENGIHLPDWKNVLDNNGEAMSLGGFAGKMHEMNLRNSILVDCTASEDVVDLYEESLQRGISIVTPNKVACSGRYELYKRLKQTATQRGAKFLFETNVGAGLPVIKTLNDLTQSGDKILKIEAILSGTLNFLFNEHKAGVSFSSVVKQAKDLGYSEPDPRIDMNGLDVARKILILSREAGAKKEAKDVVSENFLPEECQKATSIEEFFTVLPKYDDHFEKIRSDVEKAGNRQRYVAVYENGNLSTGLRVVGPDSPFYQVEGNDNLVLFWTERYRVRPLIVKGAGAGAEVTAAGIFADIIRIANF
ncbi:bifunctional aspartate kinase/homoserine dehydrogenase I [Cytophagaceae bacterium YF14B1]|uniref:Bifunctional aspartate kinase/homoserine dehydrogenase I n=1 Tax=Xanthocytophaga flava TaxID=3048013 RepID=A0AAE3QTR7_9BACT|nr:bifunctional aspartate kinase/homoserine dehydrogenase I [Xanthocytophaga flavus]MDJ1483055.1 bifunctional aspartate kinase/homoserine dehydrogenase I [Xanthocytophaga flavus]